MGNTTLQQKEHREVPSMPGKGAGDEAHIQYRLAVLAICSEMHEAGHTYADIAARFCLDDDTLREWRRRYKKYGKEGLRPRDRKPKRKRKSVIDDPQLRDAAVKMRKEWPCGGAKLAVCLRRKGFGGMSESNAKRLITSLLKEKRITRVLVGKDRRQCRGGKTRRLQPALLLGAKPFERAFADKLSPGERVQADTFFVRYNGGQLPVISAIDVRTRFLWFHIVHQLSSHAAGVLLHKVHAGLQQFGFALDTAQVDHGPEFFGGFAAACEELGIERMVNIKGNPKCGAYIESSHGAVRRECINTLPRHCTAAQIHAALSEYASFYNTERPHGSLGMESPIMVMKRLSPCHPQNPNM